MGNDLRLPLDAGGWLVLWVDDYGRLRYRVEMPGQEDDLDNLAGFVVSDDLAVAQLAVWSRDRLREGR